MSTRMETLEEKGAAEVRNTGTEVTQPQLPRCSASSAPSKTKVVPICQDQALHELCSYGKPLAGPCEVIQARFVAMLECANQELF